MRVKYCSTALFDLAVPRKRRSAEQENNVKRRKLNDEHNESEDITLSKYVKYRDYSLIYANEQNERDEVGNIRATLELSPLFIRKDNEILTEVEEHVRVVEKGI